MTASHDAIRVMTRALVEAAAGTPLESMAADAAENIRQLLTEISAMQPVVDAAEALVPDWRDTSGSMSRVDALNVHCDRIADAVDALHASKGIT